MTSAFLERCAVTLLLPGVWILSAFIPVTLYMLVPPKPFQALCAAYASWYLWDFTSPFRGGWKVSWFRRLKWYQYCASYNSFKCIKEDLPALKAASSSGPLMFGCHPHGVMCASVFHTFGFDHSESIQSCLPNVTFRVMTIKATFFVPLWREFTQCLGFIDASRSSASKAFKKGHSVAIVPGGAAEALLGEHNSPALILNKRKGFCKLAIQSEIEGLVPCFSFGENEMFDHISTKSPIVNIPRKIMKNVAGVTMPLLYNIVPKRRPLRMVLGKPILLRFQLNLNVSAFYQLIQNFRLELNFHCPERTKKLKQR